MEKMKMKNLFVTALFLLLIQPCLMAQDNAPGPFPDRVILNLTEDPLASVAVTWRTDETVTNGFCEYQAAPVGPVREGKSRKRNAATTRIAYSYEGEPTINVSQHSVILAGLQPGTRYIYRVGSEGYMSEWYEYRVPAKEEERISFIYFGDPQTDLRSQWSRVLRSAYAHRPDCDFMLYGGDLINRAGRDKEWQEWFHAGSFIYAMVPQVMTPGNHDYNGLKLDPHWNAQFTQPNNGPSGLEGTCFFVDFKNLRLISIDSAC